MSCMGVVEICLKKVEVQQKFCSASYLLEITNPSGKKSLTVGICETVETRLKEREDRLSFLFLPLHQDRFNRLKNLLVCLVTQIKVSAFF